MKDWIKIQRDQEASRQKLREVDPNYFKSNLIINYHSGREIKEGEEVFYGLLPTEMPCCPKIITFNLDELDVLYKVVEIDPYDTLPKLKKIE